MIPQLLTAVVLLATVPTPQVGTAPGELYPDLELPVISGAEALGAKTLRLSSLRGKRVLLIEFASW